MADLKEESKWEPGIRQFETSDPVQGGPDGVDNIALKQLGNRTRYLKDRADAADKAITGLGTRADATDKQVEGLGTDKVARSGDAMKGKLLGKAGAMTPNNTNNAGFAFDGDPDSGMFSPAEGHVQLGAQGVPYVVMVANNLTLGAAGWLSLIAGGAERGRITLEGRWLIGGAADNGQDAVRVQGSIGATGGIRSAGYDANGTGAQFRALGTDYGVMLRNDNKSAWLLSTNKGDPNGTYNDYRPFAWALDTGAVRIDGTGCGTNFGGYARFAGNVESAGVGYFGGGAGKAKDYGSGVTLGANTGGDIVLKAAGADKDMKLWDVQSNNDSMSIRAVDDDWTIGIPAMRITRVNLSTSIKTLELVPNTGRVLSAGAWDDGRSSFQNKGSLKSSNSSGALVASNGGGAGQTSIQLTREGAPTDQKTWEVIQGADGSLAIRSVNDTYTNSQAAINVTRGSTYALGTLQLMPQGGRATVGRVVDDGSTQLQIGGMVTAVSPPAGDNSNKLITSAWFAAAVADVQIGQIVWEARTAPRAGFLKLNGTELKRVDYPLLWAYAQGSGALVADADWGNGRHGCFSSGDGNTTFRLPDLRGEFIRCWDDARGADAQRQIGSWQDSLNRLHAHGASAAAVGDHSHGAWTDSQGWHAHSIHDPGHDHGIPVASGGGYIGEINLNGGGRGDKRTTGSGTGISINGDGAHGHNVGIGGGGAHSHAISVAVDGGNESRPRNLALLAMIRAY
ncbi:phage tail protein [Burkholderia sp. lyk4-R2A-23]|uniref:phage tail protein n=1 Tax=Burkholderia sp. lyk4-R2A-23 TaxID=3040284 RepID=UPI0025515E47|nr:phage tail protein [Burkholderia sp. lyk4-R2A-23]